MTLRETVDGLETLSRVQRDQDVTGFAVPLARDPNSVPQSPQDERPTQCRGPIAMA